MQASNDWTFQLFEGLKEEINEFSSNHSAGDSSFWRGIQVVDGMKLERGDNFVLLQNHEDQVSSNIFV